MQHREGGIKELPRDHAILELWESMSSETIESCPFQVDVQQQAGLKPLRAKAGTTDDTCSASSLGHLRSCWIMSQSFKAIDPEDGN